MKGPKKINVSLFLPYIFELSGEWEPDEKEREAAWEMYVELVTRISVVELYPNEGLLREALTSLYSLYNTTRDILRKYGPEIATPNNDGELSFGYISVAVLNTVLRPVLAKWHPLLLDYEDKRPGSVSQFEHEKKWEKYDELRNHGVSNITVYANDTPFDEDTEFDSDTISAIRGMIDVNGNEGTLQAILELDIGDKPYEGNLVVGFIKVNEDWKISSVDIELFPE